MRFRKNRHGSKHASTDEPRGVETLDLSAEKGPGSPPGTGPGSKGQASAPGGPTDEDAQTKRLPTSVPNLEVLRADQTRPGADSADIPAGANVHGTLDPAEQEAYAQLKRLRAERRRKKLIRRGIAAGVIVALVAAVAIWRHASTSAPAGSETQVITQPVYRGPFTNEITGSGPIKPASSTLVTPQIDGTIESVNVVLGQQVAEGDVLFTIKNDELDRAVAEAERGIRTAESGVTQAKQALADSHESLSDAKDALKKAKAAPVTQLTDETGAVVGDNSSEVDAGISSAKEGVRSAEQAVTSAEGQVQSANIALEQANDAYDKAVEQAEQRTVRAPAAGSIIQLSAQTGASVGQAAMGDGSSGPTGSLCQIADLSQMTVTMQVSEVDVNKVQVGQAATATFSAAPDAMLNATVRSIATTSSSDSSGMYGGYGGGGVTYAVDLVIPAPDARLKPGMTANVSVVTETIDTALIVPAAALTDLGDGTGIVYVEDDAEVHAGRMATVTVLANNGSEAAVESTDGSLAEGDAVVISGMEALTFPEDAQTGGTVLDGTAADSMMVNPVSGATDAAGDAASDTAAEAGANAAGAPDEPAESPTPEPGDSGSSGAVQVS